MRPCNRPSSGGGTSCRIDVEPSLQSAPLPRLSLVLGGARSGKSRYAESLVEAAARARSISPPPSRSMPRWRTRIRRHRARRGPRWTTLEEPFDLAERLLTEARADRPILVDCLTLWLSNHLLAGHDIEAEIAALDAALPRLGGPVVLVANEVGLGIVPENALARAFRDHAGRLNQTVAARADRVVFIAAGLPLVLRERG